ncbi:MAG: hypothetical protein KF773_27605 [Deltaproteobacteria bacterium]|nr:hypothetical protein [Deltaproteobacteria bacterium]
MQDQPNQATDPTSDAEVDVRGTGPGETPSEASAPGRLMRFAREHPALSAIGAAGIGLFGGAEVAAGVLIGAGVMAVLHRRRRPPLRERAQSLLDRAPHELKERVRAVMQAARGRLHPNGVHDTAAETATSDPNVAGPASS